MERRKETSVSIVPRNTEGQKEAPSSIVPRNTKGQDVTKVSENIPAIEHAVIGPEKTQASKDETQVSNDIIGHSTSVKRQEALTSEIPKQESPAQITENKAESITTQQTREETKGNMDSSSRTKHAVHMEGDTRTMEGPPLHLTSELNEEVGDSCLGISEVRASCLFRDAECPITSFEACVSFGPTFECSTGKYNHVLAAVVSRTNPVQAQLVNADDDDDYCSSVQLKLVYGLLAYDDMWPGGRRRKPWNVEESSTGLSAGPAASFSAGFAFGLFIFTTFSHLSFWIFLQGMVPFAVGSMTLPNDADNGFEKWVHAKIRGE
ncbi:hypothetical protein TorRG33x02_050050 [Trema orientale]|uniref:Uncharacterized protein n=1 Tax=Trema orientale TaxID=63057 RepID=A0A2P5FMX3_TREOI|nr:hypothetical protein TorRG33x02_050050 [Trema orientale]